ncbi:MAG TPA: demethylmenaquinone methyltransferase [Dactylosporangium sp.]|jgi:demethylmenaquinone methyltransferase/2-methoxy-6-polyprenyl-1,4-benzoquinol methylase|nr:demethylmenaquinone methyltransferase [Dactylosporangium sp.]
MTRASLSKEPHEVAAMFDGVARRYDVTNTVLSGGRDRMWRRETRLALGLKPGEKVLDLGAGTGVSTLELGRSGAYAVGADISVGMLQAGREKRPEVPLLAADALHLPFDGETFDAVTISFALRNIADTDAALAEMARVTKPGGRLVVCEFSTPTWRPFRAVYQGYLVGALPQVAKRVSSNPSAYEYLAESIRAWPDQEGLAARIGANGWRKVAWRNLTGGVVAMHRGFRI